MASDFLHLYICLISSFCSSIEFITMVNETLVGMLSSPWQTTSTSSLSLSQQMGQKRDVKRRQLIAYHYNDRTRLAAVLRNQTLPVEIRVG